MAAPDKETLQRLLRWRPPHGVMSVYVDVKPGDRGEGWRIALRNGLREAVAHASENGERELKAGVRAAAARVERRFANEERPPRRGQIGFIEGAEGGRELWYSLNAPVPTSVAHRSRPLVQPLLAVLDDGAPRGIAALSRERVRLLGWSLEGLEEIDGWDMEVFALDWRERKSRSSADPAQGQGTTSSGRDQHAQRLEAEREHFLREAGRLSKEAAQGRGWHELLVFGDEEEFRAFSVGYANTGRVRLAEAHNLIGQPDHAIAERVEALLPELNREREQALVERVIDQALGGTHGSLGLQETAQALSEGRVERLLFDAERNWEGVEVPEGVVLGHGADGDSPLVERLVDVALETSADVTPIEGPAAARLADYDGLAALLRY
jgi:hypothetical protein